MHQESQKQKVKSWWNNYPFTYFVKEKIGSWEFFRNIDRKILKWVPWAQEGYPLLSYLIPYHMLKGKRVLDVGCGTGWSSEQFARAGAELYAVDLTETAVELTKKRFQLYHLQGDIQVADAEYLPFPDNYFDYVLAWGVLMHTPHTERAIHEIYRVLKPGGCAGAMMYNKNSLHWRWHLWFGKGILQLKLLTYSAQELANKFTDGAEIGGNMLTKFYTPKELIRMWSVFPSVKVTTNDHPDILNVFPHRWLPLGGILSFNVRRLIANRWGLSAWIEVVK